MNIPKDRIALLLAIGGYAGLAALLAPGTYGSMIVAYAGQLIVIPLLLMIALPVAGVVGRPAAPLAHMLKLARSGIGRIAAVAAVFCIGIAAFTTFKIEIPRFVPFYADPGLADLDLALHFGHNPGEIVHAIVPSEAGYLLGVLYGLVWFVLWFGLIAFVALSEDQALRQRYFWSMALVLALLGTLAALAFSSVGPILYERIYHVDRFARLVSLIEQSPVGDYMRLASSYLFDTYHGGAPRAGAGISAMPSIHLAIVTLNALMLTRIRPLVGVIAWLYVGVILLGSVYLGWHYAIDGYFSIAVTTIIWHGVGSLQRRTARPAFAEGAVAVGGKVAAPRSV
ncbi:MAG TPA: hypothetical protein GYA10_00410 [Alphaproteobacteria bacterium]|nr:hypothetical protein [Alphaproteobacteria bacterium]